MKELIKYIIVITVLFIFPVLAGILTEYLANIITMNFIIKIAYIVLAICIYKVFKD